MFAQLSCHFAQGKGETKQPIEMSGSVWLSSGKFGMEKTETELFSDYYGALKLVSSSG